MLRYLAAASFYKLFSLNPLTRKIYQFSGNIIGNFYRKKGSLPQSYLQRVYWIKDLLDRYHLIRENTKLLELGTGWAHWESLVIRALYDIEVTLFDVTDKRQLGAFKKFAFNLFRVLHQMEYVTKEQLQKIAPMIEEIQKVSTFSQLYKLLNWSYVLEKSGSLRQFPDNAFDLVYSYNVLEHVYQSLLPEYICQIRRVLKPGGYSFHKIDISDHFTNYDPKASEKAYLRFSNKVWKTFFENDILYINRIQRSTWLQYFEQSGLKLIEENSRYFDIQTSIHNQHKNLNDDDINCVTLYLIHQKKHE